MNLATTTIQVRDEADEVTETELVAVNMETFDRAVPWRQFRWYRNQRHYSGSYWCATTSGVVGYESRLELANLLLQDFDPRIRWILAQPFLVSGADGQRARRHVPDYLVESSGGELCVIDVKPAALLADERISQALDWSRRVVEACGWEYRVASEPDAIVLANVRFLAAYRRSFQFYPIDIEAARLAVDVAMPFSTAVRRVREVANEHDYARALVLHLVWRGQVTTDLSKPLQRTAVLKPAQ